MAAEQITMIIFFSVFAVPGLIVAAFLLCGNGADLIAGYNTASPEERAKWDEKAMCRGTGILILLMLGCIELACVGAALGSEAMMWTGGVLLVPVTAGGLIYINTSKRFKRK